MSSLGFSGRGVVDTIAVMEGLRGETTLLEEME
jgi:hypothetical protein